jgi:hypothetical protein
MGFCQFSNDVFEVMQCRVSIPTTSQTKSYVKNKSQTIGPNRAQLILNDYFCKMLIEILIKHTIESLYIHDPNLDRKPLRPIYFNIMEIFFLQRYQH